MFCGVCSIVMVFSSLIVSKVFMVCRSFMVKYPFDSLVVVVIGTGTGEVSTIINL